MSNKQDIPENAWELLSGQLTDARRARLESAAAQRTRRIRLVVQDVHHPHNVSACLRSAEAFGIQNVDIVSDKFSASTVAKGVAHWLTINRYSAIQECAEALKLEGYRLAAAWPPRPGVIPLEEIPLEQPIAVMFGNEHGGLADAWTPFIDLHFSIPMVGLVESLNISVSAAITLQSLTSRARRTLASERFHLPAHERQSLLNQWICAQVPTWEEQLRRR